MIFKQPSNGSCKIGRKIEFSNPLKYSNKKHFWNGGVANYGLLTTEQIQMYHQMKQRQKKAHLYDTKSNSHNLNYSIKELKYQGTPKLKRENEYNYKQFELRNWDPTDEEERIQLLHKLKVKRRSVSQFRSYDQGQSTNDKFNTIAFQQTPCSLSELKKVQALKRFESNRRVKTVGIQEIHQTSNPEETNKIDSIFSGLLDVDKHKVQKNNLRIESGNIKLNHSPQTLKNTSKSIQKPSHLLHPNIYSQRSEQQAERIQISKIQELKHNLMQKAEKMYRRVKKLDVKTLTRHKLRRDHSPTFCNSIDYPLKYFRHI